MTCGATARRARHSPGLHDNVSRMPATTGLNRRQMTTRHLRALFGVV